MKIPFLAQLFAKRAPAKATGNPFADWPVGSLAFVSKLCMGPSRVKVRYLKRDHPRFPQDSGWMLFSGDEPEPLSPADFVPTALAAFVRDDPSLAEPFESPIGAEWTRRAPEDVWLRIVGDEVVDREGRVVGKAR